MGNDRVAALELYRWNLQITAAFIVPLQMCEIAVRNGVAEAVEAVHDPLWPWSNGFLRSLPVPKRPHDYSPERNLREIARTQPTTGKVIAELNFAFWEKIFTVGQDGRLWLPHFRTVFPGVPLATPIPQARARAFNTIMGIRKFRNRIAHHEPIFARNLGDDYATVLDVISWRSPVTAGWVDGLQQVTGLIGQKP